MEDEISPTGNFNKGDYQQDSKWRYATLELIPARLFDPELIEVPNIHKRVYALFLKKYTNHDYGRTPLRQNPDEINKNIAHRSNGLLNLINQAAKDGWELTDNFPLQEGQRIGGQNCTVIVPMMRQRIN
ncbi:MAG: hypothetical protein HOB52_02980 [Euryarchaeota archaeon]|nr:hypothetical protein [Euryarchaeota archaeon]